MTIPHNNRVTTKPKRSTQQLEIKECVAPVSIIAIKGVLLIKTRTSDKIIWLLYFLRIQCKHFFRRLLRLGTLSTDMTFLITIVTSDILRIILALKRLVTCFPTLVATITLLALISKIKNCG